MANTPNDNTPFYEYLVDDPEMMASTPLSPHFSPNMFGGAFDVRDRPHHATRAGNQPTPGPGHHGPSLMNQNTQNEPSAETAIQTTSIAAVGVPGLATVPVQPALGLQQQHQQHHSALLTGAEGQGQGFQRHHQFGTPFADHQGPPALLHGQVQVHAPGTQHAPAPWLPPGYGAPLCHDIDSSHEHDATSASTPVTISAAGGLSSGSGSGSNTADGQLFGFGFAAPPLPPPPPPAAGEQSFLGGEYADITPLSTAAAMTAASGAATATFDFRSSPWRPRLQDSSSVTLTPNIAAVAAAELNHDVRKHSSSRRPRMDDDSDAREPSWDDDDNEYQDRRRGGGGGAGRGAGGVSNTSPRPRRQQQQQQQQRKGKRRAAADAGGGAIEDDDEPTSPAGRTSVSGRSNKSASVASTTGSSSKTAPAPAPRLRSASRTSKNASQKPAETAEERRTRASHNLVEKQYRNRLNAQFEGLLNVLPEQVRGTGGGGAVDGEESDPQPADQERRVSKAEVLDMARRHIKSLERERDELQRERGDLLRNLEMMEREMAASTGGTRLDEFLDVEGPPDERGPDPWRNA